MMTKVLMAVALGLTLGGSAFAHEEHCHMKDAAGKVSDAKGVKTEAACTAKGGEWKDHHLHCHKAGADGKMADFPEAKDEKSCAAQGGKWSDHGHEGLAD